jgi:hypothetical protein
VRPICGREVGESGPDGGKEEVRRTLHKMRDAEGCIGLC